MKNPLHYQISEYDCGPTSMLNAIIYLFDRDEIPPEVIRNTMLYCLDCYSKEGIPGKRGTSRAAMMFLSNWLNEFGNLGMMTVSSEYLSGSEDFSQERFLHRKKPPGRLPRTEHPAGSCEDPASVPAQR